MPAAAWTKTQCVSAGARDDDESSADDWFRSTRGRRAPARSPRPRTPRPSTRDRAMSAGARPRRDGRTSPGIDQRPSKRACSGTRTSTTRLSQWQEWDHEMRPTGVLRTARTHRGRQLNGESCLLRDKRLQIHRTRNRSQFRGRSMADKFAKFVSNDYRGRISRRRVLQAFGVAAVGAPLSAFAQGRCMLTPGTPACNTADIKPLFEPTGWKTISLDHLTFRVADYQKEVAVLRRPHGMEAAERRWNTGGDGHWRLGSVIFKQAPAGNDGRFRRRPAVAAGARRALSSNRSASNRSSGMRRKSKRTCESAALRQLPKTATTGSKAST